MSGDETKEEGWQLIDDQAGLDSLDGSVNWHDAEPVAFVGDTVPSNALFPAEVARSGFLNANVRVLFFVADRRGSHLEIVFVDCDEIGSYLFRGLSLSGHVDSLKRVDVVASDGERRLRCSRLMYRFIDVDQTEARRFYGFERAPRHEDAG
jgi:hypothetical protein